MTDTTPKQEDAVKCDNKEPQANEVPQVESQSVSVTVTGFSLFATTLKQRLLMADTQIELTPEEEARIKWEQLLRGKSAVVVDTVVVTEEVEEPEEVEVVPEVLDDSAEAVLARLYKSTKNSTTAEI